MRKLKMQYTWMLTKQTELSVCVWTYKHKTQWAQGYVTKKHKTVNFNETLHFAVCFSLTHSLSLFHLLLLYISFAVWEIVYIYMIFISSKQTQQNNKYVELKNQNDFPQKKYLHNTIKSVWGVRMILILSIFKDSFYYDSIIVKLCKKII